MGRGTSATGAGAWRIVAGKWPARLGASPDVRVLRRGVRSTGTPARWPAGAQRQGRGALRASCLAWLGLPRCLRRSALAGWRNGGWAALRSRPPPGSLGCLSRRGPSTSPGAQTRNHADAEGSRGVTHWWIGRRCVHSLCANRRARAAWWEHPAGCVRTRAKGDVPLRPRAARVRRLCAVVWSNRRVRVCKVECTSVHRGQLSVCFFACLGREQGCRQRAAAEHAASPRARRQRQHRRLPSFLPLISPRSRRRSSWPTSASSQWSRSPRPEEQTRPSGSRCARRRRRGCTRARRGGR